MIIQNGTIEFKTKTVNGIDAATGYPVAPSLPSWGTPFPCQYAAVNYSNLGVSNGEHFTMATWSVLVEENAGEGEQVRLKDCNGDVVGEYSVIQAVRLEAVCQTRLLLN